MKIKCPTCNKIFDFSPDVVYNGPDVDTASNSDDTASNTAATPVAAVVTDSDTNDGQATVAVATPVAAPTKTKSKSKAANPVDDALASTATGAFTQLLGNVQGIDTGDVKAPAVNIAASDDDQQAAVVTAPASAPATAATGIKHPSGFVLTADNYYSDAADRLYMSNSRFKSVYGTPVHPIACPDAAINGPKAESEALLIGGYVDSFFEGPIAFDNFKTEHEDQLMMKSKKDYLKFVKDADAAIEKVKKSNHFMDFAGKGDHQTIMVGTIAGHDFKIKMDAYHKDDKIVDVKYVKSADLIYNAVKKDYITFIEDYGYNIQGAIYQEIVRQNTGKKLPFYIAYITKESEPDFDVVEIPQQMLDEALEYVKMKLTATPYADILANPKMCGRKKCKWCLSKKIVATPKTYDEFVNYCS